MNNLRFWKSVFFTKSIITCTEGAVLFFADFWLRNFLNAPPLVNVEYSQMFFGLVFWIGIAYWWVGNDLFKNHGIIKFGIFAQSSVFALMAYHASIGNLHPLYLIGGVIDLIFAILYTVFLVLYSANQAEPALEP